MESMITLRIHHFFDIIRDYGNDKPPKPHPYGHSLHKIYKKILLNPKLEFRLVLSNDSICKGCSKKTKSDHCKDKITHRKDFVLKEDFNNHIDKRIFKVCNISANIITTPYKLLLKAPLYLENIEYIYEGNDSWHTEKRKQAVRKGIKKYYRSKETVLTSESYDNHI